MSYKIESVIKNLPSRKSPNGFTAKFYQTYEEELVTILPKQYEKTKEEGFLPNSFYESSNIFIPKSGKDTTKKKTTDQHPW